MQVKGQYSSEHVIFLWKSMVTICRYWLYSIIELKSLVDQLLQNKKEVYFTQFMVW